MKNNKSTKKKDNYNFDVFKNYKCDGQYIMVFNDANVNIVEEDNSDDGILNIKQQFKYFKNI